MKKIRNYSLIAIFSVSLGLSSCGIIKGGCDCPKFGQKTMPAKDVKDNSLRNS